MRAPRLLLLFLAVALVLHGPAAASDEAANRKALILIRALAYDRKLRDRAGAEVVLAVVYRKGRAESEAMADSAMNAHGALNGVRVQGLPLRVTRLRFLGVEDLRAVISAQGVDVLYLCAGLEADLDLIAGLTRQLKLLTVGGVESFVNRGATMGVFPRAERPTIVIHLAASRLEGADFSPDLLNLAEVLR